MDYEKVLGKVGKMGRYQIFLYCLSLVASGNAGIHLFNVVFTMGVPQHRCAVPGLQNDTFTIQNEAHAQLVQAAIPCDPDKGGYSKCSRFAADDLDLLSGRQQNVTSLVTVTCTRWVYSTDVFLSSIVSQLDLVCARQMYRSHSNMVGMVGIMVISMVAGPLSDRFGRKKLFVLLTWLQLSASVAVVFVRSEVEFLVLRFVEVGAGLASFMCFYGIVSEISAPSKRIVGSVVTTMGFHVGMLWVILLAYFVREWKTLQLLVTVPLAFTALVYPLATPESPKWLVTKKRYTEAKAILKTMARVNRKPWSEEITVSKDISESRQASINFLTSLRLLFGSRILTFRLVILTISWTVNALVYYGIGLNLGTVVPGDVYLNFFVITVGTIILLPLSGRLLLYRGRQLALCSSMILGGACCILTIFPAFSSHDLSWLTTVLSYLGKMLLTVSFMTIWLYTTELFPTDARLSGLGVCNFFGRTGAVVSPYIAMLPTVVEGKLGQALPLLVFGICGLVSGTLCLLLPETGNGKLPDTVREAEMLRRRKFLRHLGSSKQGRKKAGHTVVMDGLL